MQLLSEMYPGKKGKVCACARSFEDKRIIIDELLSTLLFTLENLQNIHIEKFENALPHSRYIYNSFKKLNKIFYSFVSSNINMLITHFSYIRALSPKSFV